MTNKEKFKEVFGFEPNTDMCPFSEESCPEDCPGIEEFIGCARAWWNDTYREE